MNIGPHYSGPGRTALAASVLSETGRLRLRVWGESMLPTIWPGDVVEVAACPLYDARPGEVVLAARDGRFYLHRLLTIGEGTFVLGGDAISVPDPPFQANAFLGRVVGAGRFQKRIPTASPNGIVVRACRFLLLHSGLALRIATKIHSLLAARSASKSSPMTTDGRETDLTGVSALSLARSRE